MAVLDRRNRRQIANTAFVTFSTTAAVIAITALAAILFSLLVKGVSGLNLDIFLLSTPAPQSHGGLANAIVGSLMLCTVAMIGAVIVGVLAGTFLAEYSGLHPLLNAYLSLIHI